MIDKKRKVPEINSSSTADIAFLLLIFFLVTTSIDSDWGITKLLPPPPDEETETTLEIKQRNVLQLYLDKEDALKCGTRYIDIAQLKDSVKDFIENENNDLHMPEKTLKEVEFIGTTYVNDKHVILLQSDRDASYQAYINVQNALMDAYGELRDDFSEQKFGKPYAALDNAHQQAVREVYPMRISEAEPQKHGE